MQELGNECVAALRLVTRDGKVVDVVNGPHEAGGYLGIKEGCLVESPPHDQEPVGPTMLRVCRNCGCVYVEATPSPEPLAV